MFLDTNQKEECFGCTACMQICPTKAITMHEDKEGFSYPVIDQEKCIHCNMCRKVCPYQKEIKETKADIYGVKLKEIEKRKKSQSGGAFTAIATSILENSGVVYGVAVCEGFVVKHIRIQNLDELDKLKGSKYVQSNAEEVYEKIEKDLREDKLVLFSGTACQIQGLLNYIEMKKIPSEKLYTCDLVCHGVPSPKIYQEYIQFFEKKYHSKMKNFNFRDKRYGWGPHDETMTFKNHRKITRPYYRNIFYSNNPLRPSCYSCQFANTNRITDFTIADFWGIEKANQDFYSRFGVSLLFVQPGKGQELFKKILEKNELIYFQTNLEDCLQHNLQKPTDKPIERQKFWEEYNKSGFEFILRKYGNYGAKQELQNRVHYFLRRLKIKLKNIKEGIR